MGKLYIRMKLAFNFTNTVRGIKLIPIEESEACADNVYRQFLMKEFVSKFEQFWQEEMQPYYESLSVATQNIAKAKQVAMLNSFMFTLENSYYRLKMSEYLEEHNESS